MRGKKAKRFRLQAKKYVSAIMQKDLMEGWNEYHQVDNRLQMMPLLDDDGMPVTDQDGEFLMKPEKTPGTIHCAWHVRVIYKLLKKNNGRISTARA